MVSRLDTYRSELALRTLVALNEKIGGHIENHGQRFDRLEHKDDDIIEAISISQRNSLRETAIYHQKTQEQLQEIIAAILTHRDGQTTTISQPMPQSMPLIATNGNLSRQLMTLRSAKKSRKSKGNATASLSDYNVVQHRVLEYLSFRKIRDRVDEVAPAHQNSFGWIFESPKPTQRPWTDFLEWMRTGLGCYWINGKAGSGKSTLMKYIFNTAITKQALLTWAAGRQLLVASYFSWNLGSSLQKTHIGLLRSVLHDILEQVPDLIPIVLPKLLRAASVDAKEEPTIVELKNAFLKLAEQTSMQLSICLFIDGIDEFEDDHVDIVNLLGSIPSMHLKVVLSSRPLSVCVDAFGNCSGLRLQDLTYKDIRSYTSDKVRAHKRWRELLDEEGQEAEKLVDATAEKAEGVFLWVILAVASLLEGLRNYDRLSDFQRRLEILPPDLENLYSHMLNRMEPLYIRQASQLLQIVLQHTRLEVDQPLSSLQLSFADEADPETAFSQEIRPLSTSSRLIRCRAMEGRVRSRCCGLVEIWQDWRLDENERILKSRVIFLHRTVVEFLGNPKVMDDLRLHTTAVGFDPAIALAKGFLIDVKTQSDDQFSDVVRSPRWQSMRRCLNFCRTAEYNGFQRYDQILIDLDKTMKSHWKGEECAEGGCRINEPNSSGALQKFDWAALELQQPCWLGDFKGFDLDQASMLILAVAAGLRQYVYYRCTLRMSEVRFGQLQQAMRAVIFRASRLTQGQVNPQSGIPHCILKDGKRNSLETYKSITDDLLHAGADANDSFGVDSYSPWALAWTFTDTMQFDPETVEWCHMLMLMLKSGANPNESVRQDSRYLVRHRTILSLLTTRISSLSTEQKLKKQVPNAEVVRMLEDLKAMLIQRGAQNREWSEPQVQHHQRDSTPAPWTSKNPGSSSTQRRRKSKGRGQDKVNVLLDENSSPSEEDPDLGSTRPPKQRGRTLRRSNLSLDEDSSHNKEDIDSSARSPSSRRSRSLSEWVEAGFTIQVSGEYPTLGIETSDGPFKTALDPLQERFDKDLNSSEVDVESNRHTRNELFEIESHAAETSVASETHTRNELHFGCSDVLPFAQTSSSEQKDSCGTLALADAVNKSIVQKRKFMSSFPSRFSLFRQRQPRSM